MATMTAWHGKTLDDHVKLRDDAAKAGYRFLSLSLHGSTGAPRYTAVMIKRTTIVAQRDWPALSADEFQAKFNEQVKDGYGPVIIAATGSAESPLFTAVFQPMKPIPLTRHRLKSGADDDVDTIQGMNKKAHAEGLIPRWLAVYGDADDPRFAAIWVPNTDKVIWNADGLVETGGDYQNRINAQTSGWCRPALVTLNREVRYLSLFVDNEVGPWVARHGLTSDQYQNEFDAWTPKGYFPVCVQGGGSDSSTRYAALFAKSEDPVGKQFQATGPVTNAEIDAIIATAMKDSPVRHASLAIVHGTKLVYARAYTWGEPDWPLVQPTSRFRLASVSKTVMALAVYQLIESKKLHLTDKMQDILQLKTPGGGAPKDPRFKDITIKHLLEHTSSLNANAYRNDVNVLAAHKAAQPGGNWHLPVTAAMTDSYIASLDMRKDNPGVSQCYNNCGYYLLGRIVAKLRGKDAPIDALQDFLFDPLHIHRIRRAPSLIATTPADEARYRAQDIPVYPSVMSDDRPLVPLGYGHEQYAKQEGSGGLSAATTDLARLIAILVSQKDNPALKGTTIVDMLSAGAAVKISTASDCPNNPDSRSGYGFDRLTKLGNGKFYGQKGGSLDTSGNVLQINGDWGFAMCWGGKATAASGWYPDYPAVMNIAKAVAWGSTDLFPQFGMPPL
jgi:CubicO group peptidase (beta-lactamase class C family)